MNKNKEYILDNGKIRLCCSNIIKMNPIEYMTNYWGKKSYIFSVPFPDKDQFIYFLGFICQFTLSIVSIIPPLSFIINYFRAMIEIKNHKEEFKQNNK